MFGPQLSSHHFCRGRGPQNQNRAEEVLVNRAEQVLATCSTSKGPGDLLSDNQRFPGVDPFSPNFLVGLLFSGSQAFCFPTKSFRGFAFFFLRVFSVTNTSYLSTTHLPLRKVMQCTHKAWMCPKNLYPAIVQSLSPAKGLFMNR